MSDFSTPLPQASGGLQATDALGRRERIKRALMHFKKAAFSFANPYEFSNPSSQGEWIARVRANSKHFAAVYGVLFAPFLLHMMTSDMWLQIGAAVLGGVWIYGYWLKADDEQLCGVPLSKFWTCLALSFVVMLLTGMLNALLTAMLMFSLVAMPHMSFHVAAGASADALAQEEMQTLAP